MKLDSNPTYCLLLLGALALPSSAQDAPPDPVVPPWETSDAAPAPGSAQDPDVDAPADSDAIPVVSGELPPEPGQAEFVPTFQGRFLTGYGEALEHYESGDLESTRQLGRALTQGTNSEFLLVKLDPEGLTWWSRTLDDLAGRLGWGSRHPIEKAHAYHLMACAERRAEDLDAAEPHLLKTRAWAGPGPLRLDAIYDLGWIDLHRAEELYDQLPEVHGATNDPMSPGYVPDDANQEDTLGPAKEAYLEARAHFAERLLIDWRDADTRANVELIQRRLKSIADIEEQRKQDEGQERSDEGDPEDQDNPESQDEDANGQKSPGGEQSEDAEPKENSEDDAEEEGEQQQAEEAESEETKEGESDEPKEGGEDEEVHMTKEEMQRLLDDLKNHGDRGEEIMNMNRRRQRQRVEKDW
jgi:hypothetical protein